MLPVRSSILPYEPGAQDLLSAYAEECSIPLIGKPEPQWPVYQMMEDAGLMKVFGLYDGPQIVGFASLLISVLPHYGKQIATLESIYVSPEYRRGVGSGRLIKSVEAVAAASGCVSILYSAPVGSEFESTLNHNRSYTRTNSVFCRRLA